MTDAFNIDDFNNVNGFNYTPQISCHEIQSNIEAILPQSNDSLNSINDCESIVYMSDVDATDVTQNAESTDLDSTNPFEQLTDFSKNNSKKMIFSHLNINSLQSKFIEVHEILHKGLSDMLFLSETKLDSSYPNAQFHVMSFITHRLDRNSHGGGLICYVKDTIPHKNRPDIAVNVEGIESIVIHVKSNSSNIFFIHVYRPPNIAVSALIHAIENMLGKCFQESKSVYIIGDLNVNFLSLPNQLSEICDTFDLKQIIKTATCFKSKDNPSLLDVILTNCPRSISKAINLSIGISDFHNYISAATKITRPSNQPKVIYYRSFKNFDNDTYIGDLKCAPFHVSQIFDDPDDQLWFHNELLGNIVDKNAPKKQRTITHNQLPYMNDILRKAINVKAALRRKYNKNRSDTNWQSFRQQRNKVNKLKRQSLQKYFKDKCNSTNRKSKHFWEIIKPFMTNKSKSNNETVTLYEKEAIVNNPFDVSNIFNDYFINITSDFSEPEYVHTLSADQVIDLYKDHPSIRLINSHVNNDQQFMFATINETVTEKKLKLLQTNKSAGFDKISPKFLRIGAQNLSHSLTPIINNSISLSKYPDLNKRAEVSPLYKKCDQLSKENYRPLSILTSTSKVFEGIMCDQILNYISTYLSNNLAAYRKLYSCNNVLVKCIENWRKALDNNHHVGCILIDLSKAFDSLPHGLLTAKLHAYGLSQEACSFILNYLRCRKQTVKLGNIRSEWSELKTGVPQGSLLGPLLFNIFINDFIFDLQNSCNVYNYADDNTLSFSHSNPSIIKDRLQEASSKAIEWFSSNFMKANPSKFQAIILSRYEVSIDFVIAGHQVKSEKSVKLLGVNIDDKLNFNLHVTNICKKAARQINALQRICKYVDQSSRLSIYESFIASNFVYCTLVYNTFTITQDRKLEKLNERALRLVSNDYNSSYRDILKATGKRMLFISRKICLADFSFKILKNMALPIESTFFRPQITPYDMRDNYKLVTPVYSTIQYGKKSIAYQAALTWNELPVSVKEAIEYNKFREMLRDCIHLNNCSCGSCILCVL